MTGTLRLSGQKCLAAPQPVDHLLEAFPGAWDYGTVDQRTAFNILAYSKSRIADRNVFLLVFKILLWRTRDAEHELRDHKKY